MLGLPRLARLPGAEEGPVITAITPTAAYVGDTVTITGSGFGGAKVGITVGDVAAPVLSVGTKTSVRTTSVTFRVPVGGSPGPRR